MPEGDRGNCDLPLSTSEPVSTGALKGTRILLRAWLAPRHRFSRNAIPRPHAYAPTQGASPTGGVRHNVDTSDQPGPIPEGRAKAQLRGRYGTRHVVRLPARAGADTCWRACVALPGEEGPATHRTADPQLRRRHSARDVVHLPKRPRGRAGRYACLALREEGSATSRTTDDQLRGRYRQGHDVPLSKRARSGEGR